ncbi:NAD(P)H-dependent oxidoreductase [Muriicola sp. Z0-33]|uniref:NAD(P)H-dependent oxidoreductase n=1 Tax=Muriicola sp. Z0-33 TaxID=2816957 RepID=UPI00223832CD|nr:NAD(P)H-dependent oxidoreductase [Muriicola sp. Z0-33]MCW5516937.1 NAD(P)H-dependent oxidoreductase [Muriicola sp. Z0-33]
MNSTKILIINGHPDEKSYNYGISEAYKKGAQKSGAEVQEIRIRELEFNLNLQFGYRKKTPLEPDLIEAQHLIKWANHLVWVYPVWWASIPALMKGFIDRVFQPGFAFKKRENSVWWDKYLTGKTAHLICTLDQPSWYYKWINRSPSHTAMKRLTLQFVGIKKVKITAIGPLRLSKENYRKKWIEKIEQLGFKNK